LAAEQLHYIALISPYASFFEVSIALNISHAASQNIRNVFKSAIKNDTKKISKSFEENIEETFDKLNLMSDEDIDAKQKEKLSNSLLDILSSSDKNRTKHNDEINNSNDRIVDQIKPMYIYVAIINLFVLFLAGQESIHQKFPGNELLFLLIASLFTILTIWMLSYTEKKPPAVFVAFFALTVAILSFFEFGHLYQFFEINASFNKYLVDLMLFVSFTPFFIAFSRLLTQNIWLGIKYFFTDLKYKLKYHRIRFGMKNIEEAKNFLNSFDSFNLTILPSLIYKNKSLLVLTILYIS